MIQKETIKNIYNSTNRFYNPISKKDAYRIINELLKITDNITLTPLSIEVLMNNKEEIQRLHDEDYDVNERNEEGFSPLDLAILLNNKDTIAMLLSYGAYINDNDEYIPIISAAEQCNPEVIKLLINHNADVNKLDKDGFNALQHLLNNHGMPQLNCKHYSNLVYYGEKFNQRTNTKNIIDCINVLVDNGIDINHTINYKVMTEDETLPIDALSLALVNPNKDVVKTLINKGAKTKTYELFPELIYEYQDNFDFIQDLKDKDISYWPYVPIDYINYLKYKKIIKDNDIEVCTTTPEDGYRRPKMIKKIKQKRP